MVSCYRNRVLPTAPAGASLGILVLPLGRSEPLVVRSTGEARKSPGEVTLTLSRRVGRMTQVSAASEAMLGPRRARALATCWAQASKANETDLLDAWSLSMWAESAHARLTIRRHER